MTTLREYTAVWNTLDIRQINREQIRELIERSLEDSAIATKNNLAKYIRNVFGVQESKGRIPSNPGREINFGKKKRQKLKAMSRSEVEAILKVVKEENSPWYPVYRLSYELGLRSGEAYALKWSAVDFEINRIRIEVAYCSKAKSEKPPKNGETRVLPMNADQRAFLLELRQSRANDEYVLPRIAAWKHGDAAKILQMYQRRLGITETNFHSLRASFVTQLLNAGVSLPKVQAMVGHADIKTTQDYIRLTGSDLDGATDALSIPDRSSRDN